MTNFPLNWVVSSPMIPFKTFCTVDGRNVWNPVHDGIFTISIRAGFLNHQQYLRKKNWGHCSIWFIGLILDNLLCKSLTRIRAVSGAQIPLYYSLPFGVTNRREDWRESSTKRWMNIPYELRKNCKKNMVPSGKLTWQWKITIFNRIDIFNHLQVGSIFHC